MPHAESQAMARTGRPQHIVSAILPSFVVSNIKVSCLQGKWAHMSWASIRDVYHATRVADEAESYFNVVLYNAIRYTPHNLEDQVRSWLTQYFYDAKTCDGYTIGGIGKLELIERRSLRLGLFPTLRFQSPTGQLNTPLNELLRDILQCMHARYKIITYTTTAAVATDGQDESAPPSQRQRGLPMADYEELYGHEPPSDAEYEQAAKLDNLRTVEDMFTRAVSMLTWPTDEGWSDHVLRIPHSSAQHSPPPP